MGSVIQLLFSSLYSTLFVPYITIVTEGYNRENNMIKLVNGKKDIKQL